MKTTRAIHLDKSYFESWRKRIGFLAKWYSSMAAAKKELAKGWLYELFAVKDLDETRRRDETGWLTDWKWSREWCIRAWRKNEALKNQEAESNERLAPGNNVAWQETHSCYTFSVAKKSELRRIAY